MEKNITPWKGRLLVVAFIVVVFLCGQLVLMDYFIPLQKTDPRDKPLAACISAFIDCNGGGCSEEFAKCVKEVTRHYEEKYGKH